MNFIIEISRREDIERSLLKITAHNVTLKSIDWRVDVSISSSSVSRALVPTIIMQMHLSDGLIVSYEINLHTFHILRFNVALVLKEMEDLLNRQMFKLTE